MEFSSSLIQKLKPKYNHFKTISKESMFKKKLEFILFISLNLTLIHSIDNGLGKTPPMGWNGWNQYLCEVNETVFKQNANKIIELGLDKKGYIHINLDDCWQIGR